MFKKQPDVIDLSNESLRKVLESLEYRKAVRYGGMAFEYCQFDQLERKSMLLTAILKGDIFSGLIIGGYTYRFESKTIERTHPDKIKPDKKRKWLPI